MNDDDKKLLEQFDESISELNLFLGKLKKDINDINFDNNDVNSLKSLIDEVNSKFLDIKKLKMFEEDTMLFNEKYMRRLNVLPGLTGLLQINERNTDQFSTWYKYDMEYIDNWSLLLDLKIILKTPFSIFSSKIQGE